MKLFCENYNITKYQKYICINDVIENVLTSKNKSYYINKIDIDKLKIYNNEKYVTKNTLVNFLGSCKNNEAKKAIEIIKNTIETNVMIYNNKNITINTYNNELWIKAKDITTLLGFTNTKETLTKYVDEEYICKQYDLDDTQ